MYKGVRVVDTCGTHVSTTADALGRSVPSRLDTAALADALGRSVPSRHDTAALADALGRSTTTRPRVGGRGADPRGCVHTRCGGVRGCRGLRPSG